MITVLAAEGLTCTITTGQDGATCGEPAVTAFTTGGPVFAECAGHAAPIPAPAAAPARRRAVRCASCRHMHTFGPCRTPVGPGRREACGCTDF